MATDTSGLNTGNIQKVKSLISQQGLARTNRFSFIIYQTGKKVQSISGYAGIVRDIPIQCESATLPGRGFATSDIKVHGPGQKKPYESIYDNLSATFRLSSDLRERKFFSDWMDVIQSTSTGDFSYLEDYFSTIEIGQFKEQTKADIPLTKVRFIDAYPVSIGEIEYGMANNNEYAKITVNFAYTKWVYGGYDSVNMYTSVADTSGSMA